MLGRIEGSRQRETNVRWTDSIKEALDMGLQELGRAAEDRNHSFTESPGVDANIHIIEGH